MSTALASTAGSLAHYLAAEPVRAGLPLAFAPLLLVRWLPALLGYERGPIARGGLIFSTVAVPVLALLPLCSFGAAAYAWIEPWLLVALSGSVIVACATCAVGLYDRKRNAWSTLAAIVALAVGVVVGRMTEGFAICLASLTLAWTQRTRGPVENLDVIVDHPARPAHNRTRRARSIPRKLIREGQAHLLPIYCLAQLSDLAREGIAHSGSYRFADHIYRLQPSGRGPLGRWIDARFLALPATQAFHRRYKHAQHALRGALEAFPADEAPLRILAIPCGLPRDLTELAETLAREDPALLARIEYHGMDIDSALLRLADHFTAGCAVRSRWFHCGNALVAADYPRERFHAIVSTGLGEFLSDTELATFYGHVHAALLPGGTFFTSATAYEKRSETLLRAFELTTHYRTRDQLTGMLAPLGWERVSLVQDTTGLQTFVTAVKGRGPPWSAA